MNIDVIIPALNEQAAIPLVIGEIPRWVREIVVVDNGSHDQTAAVARQAGARVVCEPRRGYGYACLAGIAALNRPDVVVFMDGDHGDYPGEMIRLVSPIFDRRADFVIGSRLAGRLQAGAMLPHARFGNILLSSLVRLATGCRVTDIGPFRALTYDCLRALEMCEGKFGWTLEMMLKAPRHGYRMMEVPVSYRPRLGRSKVSGSPAASLQASAVMLWTVAKYATR